MEYDSEIDALVTIACRSLATKRIRSAKTIDGYTELALRQFRKECPTEEAQKEFINSFVKRSDPTEMDEMSVDDRARAALKFWFEVLWPNLPTIRQDRRFLKYQSSRKRPSYSVGQTIVHRKFNYRGVIIGVDPVYQGTDDWYEKVARSRPPKHRPWYHVLVNNSDQTTYVSERHLSSDRSRKPIKHPLLPEFFNRYENGKYIGPST